MTVVNPQEWEIFLQTQKDVHILQSSAWGQLKTVFGWEPVRIVNEQSGAQLLFRKVLPGVCFGYLPKGPVGSADAALFAEIDAVCQEHNAFFLRLEADRNDISITDPKSGGYKEVSRSIQPRRTIIIDLKGNDDDLLARMKQKTRYNIRLARKKGVIVTTSSDIALFARLMDVTGERDQFGVHNQRYYQKAMDAFASENDCQLLVASYEGEPLAAIMVFAYSQRAYYLYGASGNDNRNLMPNYLLQWEAMKWAASKGCTEYDMWGIPDEDEETLEAQFTTRKDGLWQVYRFKRGFGGTVVRDPGPLDKVYKPLLYAIFSRWTSN